MATYLIAYDLIDEYGSQDYQPLYDALEARGCVRTQESIWLCSSDKTAKAVFNDLVELIDGNDRLWVAELTTNHYYTRAVSGTNDFLKKYRPKRC